MSKHCFATIVTADFLDRAAALAASLNEHGEATVHTLVVDDAKLDTTAIPGVAIYLVDELAAHSHCGFVVRQLLDKHRPGSQHATSRDGMPLHKYDCLRWALKPAFMRHLLDEHESLFYTDCDLCFYKPYEFLFEDLDNYSVLLSPHWRSHRQLVHAIFPDEYRYNFTHGIYNAGFVGATRRGLPILDWWAEMCHEACIPHVEAGYYVDQRYLDVIPTYYHDAGILRHKGCNVAAWNLAMSPRTEVDGEIYAGGDPIIFIHYSPITIQWIQQGHDKLLTGHYEKYQSLLTEARRNLLKHGLFKHLSYRPELII